MSLVRSIVAAVIVLLGPTLVRGAGLRLSTTGSVEYDSNIRRSTANAESDVVWRASLKMRLGEQGNGYDYYVEYRLPYAVSTRTATLRDLNHFVGVGGRYQLGPKTSLSLSNNFAFVGSASRQRFEDDAGVLQIDRRDELVTRINGGLTLSHTFTKRVQGNLNFRYSVFDSTDNNRRQASTVGGVGSLSYAVDSKNRVGFGANVTRQAFDDLPGRPGSETITYRGFLSWIVRFDETLSLSLRGGPTVVSTVQNRVLTAVVNPFSFEVLPGGVSVFDAAVDDPPFDGVSDRFLDFPSVPDGSLLITPFDCGPQLSTPVVDGMPVLACGIRSVILKNGTNDVRIQEILDDTVTLDALPSAGRSRRVTFFGTASLAKRWTPRVRTSIDYRRTQSDASGLGGTAILDAVGASVSWRLSQLWSSSLRFDWTQRESAANASQNFRVIAADPSGVADVPALAKQTGARVVVRVPNEISTRRWAIGARFVRTLTPRLKATLRLTFNRQSSRSGSAGRSTDFDTFGAILGFSYLFDPIAAW